MINLIVAAPENNVIGNANSIPWKLSSDMKRFKELTTNNIVLIGRKTYESIGRPLPNRMNIIISRNESYNPHPGVFVQPSLMTALNNLLMSPNSDYSKEIFIIGGGEIYKEALNLKTVDKIYFTRIHTTIEGDTFFEFDKSDWQQTGDTIFNLKDEKNEYDYSFINYIHKNHLL